MCSDDASIRPDSRKSPRSSAATTALALALAVGRLEQLSQIRVCRPAQLCRCFPRAPHRGAAVRAFAHQQLASPELRRRRGVTSAEQGWALRADSPGRRCCRRAPRSRSRQCGGVTQSPP